MRRRTLLSGGGSIEYVFSAQSTSVSVSYNGSSAGVNIQSTANGTNIGYSVVSYDGTVVTSVTTAATKVTIKYSENPNYDERSGNVVLKQNDSNKTITINVSQAAKPLDLGYGGILLDGTSGSYGSIDIAISVSFSNVPSWATVTYSSGKINVTASSTNSSSTARTAYISVHTGGQGKSLALIQLPSDYHSRSYVPMGSANWAIKNVGASSVQDYGNYYQWGAGAVTYKNEDQYHTGATDSDYILPSSADTATQVMGSGWRMPKTNECQSLTTSGRYYWVSYNGVNGGVRISDGNVLFFPAAGRYDLGSLSNVGNDCYFWSSSSCYAGTTAKYFHSSPWYDTDNCDRHNYGFSVRGVQA